MTIFLQQKYTPKEIHSTTTRGANSISNSLRNNKEGINNTKIYIFQNI